MFKNFKSDTTKSLFSNTAYQLAAKIVSMLITVLCTVIVVRTYGRQSYGEFSLMQAWPAFVFIVVDFGLNAIAAREVSKDWSLAEKYFNVVLYSRVFLSCIFILIMSILLLFFPYSDGLKNGIILNLFLILTQGLYASTNVIFQPKLRYDLSSIGYVIGYIYILVSIIVMAYLKIGVMWISFNYVIGGLITFLINTRLIYSLGIKITKSFDLNLAKQLFYQSLPLGIMFVFSQINFKSDSLMVSFLPLPAKLGLNNSESVAVYGLPYKIFEVGLVLPTFFMNAAYPILVKHMQEGKDRLKSTFLSVTGALALGGISAAVLGVLLSPFIINLIGGRQFTQSVFVLQILLSGLMLYFLTQPLAWLLVTLDRQKYLPIIYFVSAAFNITANYIFIPRYSFYASAVITHLSEFLILLLLLFFVNKAWKQKYA